MYFIQSGEVSINFYKMTQGLSKSQIQEGIICNNNSYICDYYICFDQKSEFIYLAKKDVEAISISKQFLNDDIFVKYPKIAVKIKEGSLSRYMKNI